MIRRRGTFLIICLVMMTLIVTLSFAVLHNITTDIDASTGNQRYLLAEAAAKSGFDHALEQILIDYGQATVTLPKYGGSSVQVPAITFLDGQYRAPFTAIHYPNTLSGISENNTATCDDDVRGEDYLLRPWAWWGFDVGGNWGTGYLEYDGRGRYYEPGYYNAAPTPVTAGTPLIPTPFTNLAAPLPDRHQGVFYDEQFRRIQTSADDPVADRRNARYRLRYAVGVEDLSGHLLVNPMPDMQMVGGAGQVVDYRTPWVNQPWMPAATNALWAMAGVSGGAMFGAQLAHVFQGRGYHTNADFDHTESGVAGWPKTFPLEYRNHPLPGNVGTGCWESFTDDSSITTGGNLVLTGQLYFSGNGQVKGLMGGGEILPTSNSAITGANLWFYGSSTFMHALMGPQLSFQDVAYAAHGESAYLGAEQSISSNGRPWDNWILTPFGRVEMATVHAPGAGKWYQGRVSTPFNINIMTAPPAVVSAMLLGYLPPQNKAIQYSTINWYEYQGIVNGTPTYGTPISMNIDATLAGNQGTCFGLDLLVDTTSPAFAPWPAPQRTDPPAGPTKLPANAFNPPGAQNIGQIVKPDYYAPDTRMQQLPPVWPYPGPYMEGDSSITGQGSDNLGMGMDETALINGFDFYTRQPFCYLPGGAPYLYYTEPAGSVAFPDPGEIASVTQWATVPPPPGWGTSIHDMVQKETSSTPEKNKQSYFLDLVCAMGTAIGVMRAEYNQYDFPNWYARSQFFGKGKSTAALTDPDPSQFRSLRDLDRLFLAEMGESLSAPGTGDPAQLVAAGSLKAYQFNNGWPVITPDYVPKNNILSLVHPKAGNAIQNDDNSVTSEMRGHVMELMLNDFRMSLLGSSPAYSDGIDPATGQANPDLAFKPLDFLGDGMTYCSCYSTPQTAGLPCAPDGTPPPIYFTVDGNFSMAKSHFYRIFSRGEIWDNVIGRKLDSATLESAIAIDPEGTDPQQTQLLYQRWVYDRYFANYTHVQR